MMARDLEVIVMKAGRGRLGHGAGIPDTLPKALDRCTYFWSKIRVGFRSR